MLSSHILLHCALITINKTTHIDTKNFHLIKNVNYLDEKVRMIDTMTKHRWTK